MVEGTDIIFKSKTVWWNYGPLLIYQNLQLGFCLLDIIANWKLQVLFVAGSFICQGLFQSKLELAANGPHEFIDSRQYD